MLKSELIKKVSEQELIIESLTGEGTLSDEVVRLNKELSALKHRYYNLEEEKGWLEEEASENASAINAVEFFRHDLSNMSLVEADLVKEALGKIFNHK